MIQKAAPLRFVSGAAIAIFMVLAFLLLWRSELSRLETTARVSAPDSDGVSRMAGSQVDQLAERASVPIPGVPTLGGSSEFDYSGKIVSGLPGYESKMAFEGVLHGHCDQIGSNLAERRIDAHIRAGEWAVHLTQPGRLMLDGATARDGRVLELVTKELEASADGFGIVHARWATGVEVRLFDALTRLELPAGTVVWESPTSNNSSLRANIPMAGQGTTNAIREVVPTPLHLPVWVDVHSVFLTAPAHAWQRVAISGSSGTRRVDLFPGGSVRCIVAQGKGAFPKWSRLRVYGPAGPGELIAEAILPEQGDVVFGGVPAGSVEVLIESAAASAQRPRYWARRVDVQPDRETVLLLDPASPLVDSHFGGITVTVRGEQFTLAHTSLTLRVLRLGGVPISNPPWEHLASEFQMSEDGTSLELRRNDLIPGDYFLELAPIASNRRITVKTGIDQAVEFQLDSVARVTVHANLPNGAKPMPTDFIRLHSQLVESPFIGASARYDPAVDAFRLSVAPGSFTLRCSVAGYDTPRETVSVVPGENALEIICTRAGRGISVALEARSQDSEYPLPYDRWSGIQVFDASGIECGFRSIGFRSIGEGECCESAKAEIILKGPGTYELRLPNSDARPVMEPVRITVGNEVTPLVAVFAVRG